MKNLLKLITILIGINCYSQNGSASTELNINLEQAYSIETTDLSVSIDMNQPDHYINGNSTGILFNHIKITSTSSYTVEVKASASQFTSTTSSLIDVSNVEVQVVGVGHDFTNNNTPDPTYTSTNQYLSDNDQEILDVSESTIYRGFNINYSIPSSNAAVFADQESGMYTTTVTFTLIPY